MRKFGKKVVLVGDGSVGSGYAFAMVTRGIADEFMIIDIARNKVGADVEDLNHGTLYSSSPVTIKAGECEDCKDADLVVIITDALQKPGETHLQLVERNTEIVKSIVTSVMDNGFDDFFLIAANPVDILTRYVREVTGSPAECVIGSGTVFDSARLRYLVNKELDVTSSSVYASIIGRYGDSEFAVWSQTGVGGISVYDTLKEETGSDAEANEIYIDTRDAAYDIIQAKGSTYYGVTLALLRTSRTLLSNENSILTVSSQLSGQRGFNDVYLGLPTLISRGGAVKIYETPLNDNELQLLGKSMKTLEDTYDSVKHLV